MSGSVELKVPTAVFTATFSSTLVFESATAVGASLIEVETTVVVVSLTGAALPSSTLMVKVVVSVLPGATRLSVGSNTSSWIAVVAFAAVPEYV